MKCSKCGKLIPEDSEFCQFCGEKIEEKSYEHSCENCNRIISEDSAFCPFCGLKVKNARITTDFIKDNAELQELSNVLVTNNQKSAMPKEHKKIGIKKLVVIISLLICVLYLPINYLLADLGLGSIAKAIEIEPIFKFIDPDFVTYVDASNSKNKLDYPRAIKLYKRLDDYRRSEKFYKELSYVYGISMYKEDKLILAEKYLKDIDYKDSKDIYGKVLEDAYEEALILYDDKEFIKARQIFKIVDDKNSKKYLNLIYAREYPFGGTDISLSTLKKQLSFADTKSVIMSGYYAYDFLKGTWRTTNGSYYFKMKSDRHIDYNLPWFEFGDYYRIENGKLELCKEKKDSYTPETRTLFKIKISDWDTIKVYCAKNGKTYTMYRC